MQRERELAERRGKERPMEPVAASRCIGGSGRWMGGVFGGD